MVKIKSIKFKNHPILKNLELDFCDTNGNAVDTVIFAGENGTGKSTILNYLYSLTSERVTVESEVVLETQGKEYHITYYYEAPHNFIQVRDNYNFHSLPMQNDYYSRYKLSGIFSDVDINFRADDVTYVTSMALDSSTTSRRSSTDLPKQIKQLLIDVQALDDAELSHAMRENPTKTKAELQVAERIPRFTNAFARMFDGLTYDRIDNAGGHKVIYFKKNGVDIPIDNLSSGEKQVVYRGCFLLKDVNATNGAFVFIDEPEISLHPSWQMKIMDYYKDIFTAEDGTQTSQIFAVTHSPFIIHNENRRNDKIIVLTRDEIGDIVVKDKPEYFKCTSVEAVQDAFSIRNFTSEKPTVYLEGRTDEEYFKKAVELFDLHIPFDFEWIGYLDKRGQDTYTGAPSLDKTAAFLTSKRSTAKKVCLYDCDTKKADMNGDNVFIRSIPQYPIQKGMNKGIENALILSDIELDQFYTITNTEGDYGKQVTIKELEKTKLCEYLCSLTGQEAQKVFSNIKNVIESILLPIFEGES